MRFGVGTAISIAVTLMLCDLANANPLYGVYVLDKQHSAKYYAPSGVVPTCGLKFQARVRETKKLDIAYDGKVHINGMFWDLFSDSEGTVVALHPRAGAGIRVEVWFWAERESAKGALTIMKTSKTGDVICADSIRYTGVFRPK